MCTDQVCSIRTYIYTTCVCVEAIMKGLAHPSGLSLRRGGAQYISKYAYIHMYVCRYVPLTADSISRVCMYICIHVCI